MTRRLLSRGGRRLLAAATCATAVWLGAGHAQAEEQDAAAAPPTDAAAPVKNLRRENLLLALVRMDLPGFLPDLLMTCLLSGSVLV